ncbi:MAG: membrane dipeptidase, partial [FCB group bacterium]|jgi:membrane dipeptidase|nr:membrane dipeptidase [FCB group bacterium]
MGVFTMQCSLPSLRKGCVDIQVATHYVPEKGLIDDCIVLEGLSKVHSKLKRGLKEPLETTRAMMTQFEEAVERGAQDTKGRIPRIVRSLTELDAALKNGDIAIIHAIEGGHSLGGDVATVDEFFERGVCMYTLAHFYENGVAPPVEGIPYDFFLKKLGCFKHKHDATKSLPDLGRTVVERMIEKGIIIDLTHCTPPAREAICDINAKRRPLVYSHTGLLELMPHELNVSAEQVKRVAETGGMVGVILMPYYLKTPKQEKGFEPIIETLRLMINYAGEEGVGFGSDFDGFTDPPDDVHEPGEYPRLTEQLLKAFGEKQTEKILGANFVRVLRAGWGRV